METMCNSKVNKRGISLVVLLITIIVALIILSATTLKILDASDNATIASFVEEVKSLEDAAKEYYLQNNTLPIIDLDTPKSKNDILDLNSTDQTNEDRKKLAEEIDSNMDNQNTTVFYKLDLSKLNVSATTRGVIKKGNIKDIYMIAYPSFRVYYIEGVEAKGTRFFSLSSKINGINNINITAQNNILESVTTETVAGLTVKRDTEDISNKMGVVINTTIGENEKVYVSLPTTGQRQLNITTTGFNSIRIDSLSDLMLTDIEKESFNKLSAKDRYMEVIKKKEDLEIARIRVDLSNYDNFDPIIATQPNINKNSSTNVLYFDVSDVPVVKTTVVQNGVISGIKEVRYEYLTKYNNETFQEENYYSNTTQFDDVYMKSEAKKADISNSGTVKIELPKEITKIQICVIDNSQNYTVYTQVTAGGINVGYSINSVNQNYLDIDLKLYTDEIISGGLVSISNDGINFTDERSFSDVPALSTQTLNFVYENSIVFDKYVYLKINMVKSDGSQEEKIMKIDLNM